MDAPRPDAFTEPPDAFRPDAWVPEGTDAPFPDAWSPPASTCREVRLTSYRATTMNEHCEYPYNLPVLPRFARDGLILAMAEPWMNSSYGGEYGEACGECWEISTVFETRTVMVTNVCPIEGNPLCASSQFHMDLSTIAGDALRGGSLDGASARPVACPVDGNIHVFVNDHNVSYLRVAFVNHRIPIRSAEWRGAGAGVMEPNPWTPVRRSGGAWELVGGGRPTHRGGSGVQFRITTTQGEVLTSEAIVPSFPPRQSTHDLRIQATDRMPATGPSCEYFPPGDVFIDDWGGMPEVKWRSNGWGEVDVRGVNPTSDGCFAGRCLSIPTFGRFAGFLLHAAQPFPRTMFRRVRFRIRTRSAPTEVNVEIANEGVRCTGHRFMATTSWQEQTYDIATDCPALAELNGIAFANAGNLQELLLDDIVFER